MTKIKHLFADYYLHISKVRFWKFRLSHLSLLWRWEHFFFEVFFSFFLVSVQQSLFLSSASMPFSLSGLHCREEKWEKKRGGLGWEKNVLKDKRKLGSLLFSTAYKQGNMIECWKLDLSSADFDQNTIVFFFSSSFLMHSFVLLYILLFFFLVSYIQHVLFQTFLRKDFFEIDILKCIF